MVILSIVLEDAEIAVAGIALLVGVDRILDMCRTAANVTGDLAACTVLNRWAPTLSEPVNDAVETTPRTFPAARL